MPWPEMLARGWASRQLVGEAQILHTGYGVRPTPGGIRTHEASRWLHGRKWCGDWIARRG